MISNTIFDQIDSVRTLFPLGLSDTASSSELCGRKVRRDYFFPYVLTLSLYTCLSYKLLVFSFSFFFLLIRTGKNMVPDTALI